MSSFDTESTGWLCPDIGHHWQVGRSSAHQCWVLRARGTASSLRLEECEAHAIKHFTGELTVGEIQHRCQQEYGDRIPADFVLLLFAKLVQLGVLVPEADAVLAQPSPQRIGLKPGVRWYQQWDGNWVLGSEDGKKHLQVDPLDKPIIEQIGQLPATALARQYGCDPGYVKRLASMLAQKQMLDGIDLPNPPRRKFTPLSLLYFKKSLFNPDRWLTTYERSLRWLWSRPMGWLLGGFLGVSGTMAISRHIEIAYQGQKLVQAYGWNLLLPFAMLSMLVISLHELAHAFTLKHFGGLVPEIGLLFMCLMPVAYTNTSDSYRVGRWQRCLVYGAGVLCQVVIAAIAFWVWVATAPSSFHTGAYLLMVSALFTVALNLNPLAKFDGYYLLAAANGINNLKGRSFGLYRAWFSRQPSPETGRHRWILAAYAPLSFLYLVLVFGKLFLWLSGAILTHIPYLALILFALWFIYYIYPDNSNGRIS